MPHGGDMIRVLNCFLLIAIVLSAIYIVRLQYENRLLYTSIANEGSTQEDFDLEYKRLQQERQNLTIPGRIEQYAQTRLQMQQATLGITEYISRDASAGYQPTIPVNVQLEAIGEHGLAPESRRPHE